MLVFISFSYFSPPGSIIWHVLTSDSDSLQKTVYLAKFWSKILKIPSNEKNIEFFTNLNVGLVVNFFDLLVIARHHHVGFR